MYLLVTSQTVKSVKYLTASFKPDMYAFFSGSSVPVRVTDYKNDVAGTSTVEFYYNRELKTITKTADVSYIPRTLNIEGASIYHGDICLYDLTDFFDSTRYAGVNDVPTLDQWVGVWQLENGIYLDRSKGFQIHIDFLGAGSEVFELWSGNNTRWVQLTSNTPRLHSQVVRALTAPDCSCPSADLSGNVVTAPILEEESVEEEEKEKEEETNEIQNDEPPQT